MVIITEKGAVLHIFNLANQISTQNIYFLGPIIKMQCFPLLTQKVSNYKICRFEHPKYYYIFSYTQQVLHPFVLTTTTPCSLQNGEGK